MIAKITVANVAFDASINIKQLSLRLNCIATVYCVKSLKMMDFKVSNFVIQINHSIAKNIFPKMKEYVGISKPKNTPTNWDGTLVANLY